MALNDEGGLFAGMNFNPFAEGGMDFSVASGLIGTCSWLFSPAKIRELFRNQYFENYGPKKNPSIHSFRNSQSSKRNDDLALGSLRSNINKNLTSKRSNHSMIEFPSKQISQRST